MKANEKIVMKKVSELRPNTYNPNVMDERLRRLLRKNMERKGVLAPVIIRKGTGEIIDGEHRWREAKKAKIAELPCIEVEISDADMMVLTVGFGRFHGEADTGKLAALVHELKAEIPEQEMKERLGFSDVELKELEELYTIDTTGLDFSGKGQEADPAQPDTTEWVNLDALLTKEQSDEVLKEVNRMIELGQFKTRDKTVRRGLAVEQMAALSGQEAVTEADLEGI